MAKVKRVCPVCGGSRIIKEYWPSPALYCRDCASALTLDCKLPPKVKYEPRLPMPEEELQELIRKW